MARRGFLPQPIQNKMRKLLLALQFLTIIPVSTPAVVSEEELSGAAAFFPLAGALQGIIVATLAFIFLLFFPAAIAAGFTLLVLIAIMGGFHLDGLADTFDALAVKSTGDRQADIERRLAVMKDSATGAIGVIAIAQVLLLKYLLIAELFSQFAAVVSLSFLLILPAFSKWAITVAMFHATPARPDGLGRIFLNRSMGRNFIVATLFMAGLGMAIFPVFLGGAFGLSGVGALIVILIVLYLFALAVTRFFERKFGGLTGDNFGAINEMAEVIILMVSLLWLQNSI